jgi:hypothetical protein
MRIIMTLFILFQVVILGTATADCGAGRFTPLRAGPVQQTYWLPTPRDHDTLFLVDPANQQYAAFDLEFGGILASLRYDPTGQVLDSNRNVNPAAEELIWGHHPGGMLQPAWSRGFDAFSYFPNPAGDVEGHGRGPAVLGAVCKDGSVLTIYSGVPDFYNNKGLIDRAAVVKNEQIVVDADSGQTMWQTPYTLTTTVSFVPNPGTTGPAYYLKLDMFIMNIDTRERVGFNGGVALYAPGTTGPCVVANDYECNFDPQFGSGSFKYEIQDPAGCTVLDACPHANVGPRLPKFVMGKYTDADHTNGIATSMAAATYFPTAQVGNAGTGYDRFWNNVGGGSAILPFKIPPLGGLHFAVFVLAGDWSAADAFNPN